MRKRARRRRHFRAIFLWSVAAIALAQLALGLAIDVALPEVRDPEYVYREELLRKQLAVNDHKPVVVLLGSSRVQNGVDAQSAAEALERPALVFNFGIPTSGPFLERVCLERLHAHGIKPDVLFFEIYPIHYNAKYSPPDLRGLDGARLAAQELAEMPASLDTVAGPARRWLVGRLVPTFRHQAELRARLGIDDARQRLFANPDLQLIDPFGWQPRDFAPEQGAILKKLAHRQYDLCYDDFELSAKQVRLIEDNLAQCRREGIRAALLLAPEGSEFRRLSSPAMAAAIERMLADLQKRFDVPVIDARTWMPDSEFFDMHHLHPNGAKAFSQRLAREAISPLLRERELAVCGVANVRKSR